MADFRSESGVVQRNLQYLFGFAIRSECHKDTGAGLNLGQLEHPNISW